MALRRRLTSSAPMDPLTTSDTPVFQTKQAFVTHALREAILDGRLAPGTRLVIDELARQFAVSAIPVREALQVLRAERLIDITPHTGAVVTGLDLEAVPEIFSLLEGIETATFRLAAERAKVEDLAALEQLLTTMEATTDDQRWAELNSRFHGSIPAIARMPRAQEALDRITVDWERLRRWFFRDHPRPDRAPANAEHRAILAALRQRDVEALDRLVRAHNRSALAHYQAA